MEKKNFKDMDAESFQGNLGTYKVIKTDDNTQTIWSEHFDECAHSLDGAVEETLYNYVEGTRVLEKIKEVNNLSIFEMGFALGIGIKATFDQMSQSDSCTFVSTEIDKALVEWVIQHENNKYLNTLKLKTVDDFEYFESENENKKVIVLIGDARQSVPLAIEKSIISKFDCFYQDPYSPRKNPTLWTVEWFELLKSIANPNAIMSTYSASTSVRKAMHTAGWGVFHRKGFHGKKASTYAIIDKETENEVLIKLNQSKVEPFRD